MIPTSNLPPIDDQMIVIQSLQVSHYRIEGEDMAIEHSPIDKDEWTSYNPGDWAFKITHPILGSYIPSKVAVINGDLQFFYYVNPGLPENARPFSSGYCYVWVARWDPKKRWRYPADVRLFIDQIVVDDEVYYVFVTNESEYHKLTRSGDRKIELTDDLAIYKEEE